MNEFEIGETVQVIGATMTGNVGTVVSIDERRNRYLVRISAVTQNLFAPDELQHFRA